MLGNKEIEEVKSRVKDYISSEAIVRSNKKDAVQFFLKNAKNSIDSASLLLNVSNDNEQQKNYGLKAFDGYLWVINSSYYSMFYTARALIESEGLKIKSEGSVHLVTFDVLVYYFYLSGKMEKKIIEDFAEGMEESSALLGKEKAKTLIDDYFSEKGKRARFTYEIGQNAMRNKAETSLKRARLFNEALRKMIS